MLKYHSILILICVSVLGIANPISYDKNYKVKSNKLIKLNTKIYSLFPAYNKFNLYSDSTSKYVTNKKNIIFIEAFGNSIGGTINYSRIWNLNEKLQFSPSIGIFYIHKEENQITNMTRTPINIRFLYGHNSKLEFGICFTPELRWALIKNKESLSYYDKYIPEKYYFLLNIGFTQIFLKNWIASARITPFYYNYKGGNYSLYGGVFIGKLF